MASSIHKERVLSPARGMFIASSLLAAFCWELLPLGPVHWRPDLLLMTLVFWTLYQSERVGLGVAFLFGLAMDVQSGNLLGQYALAYSTTCFVVYSMQRRLKWHNSPYRQALSMFTPFFTAQVIIAFLGFITSRILPSAWELLAIALQLLLWPLLRRILIAPQLNSKNEI